MGWNDLLKNQIGITFPPTLLCKGFIPPENGKAAVYSFPSCLIALCFVLSPHSESV